MTGATLSSVFRRSSPVSLAVHVRPPGGLPPQLAREIGLEALRAKGTRGTIARLVREYEVPRHLVKQCAAAFEKHAKTLFEPTPHSACVTVALDRRAIERALVASRADIPLSIRNLKRLTALFLGFVLGYGTLWNTLDAAQTQARAWLSRLNLRNVKTIAIDELFFRGRCVLVVIDLRTQTLCGLQVADDRTEATWTKLLTRLRDEQGLDPSLIVSDAGLSLVASSHDVFPSAAQQRDLFHAKQELHRLTFRLESQAYSALEKYFKAERAWKKAPRGDRSAGQTLRRVGEEADRRIYIYDRVFQLTLRAFAAFEFVDHTSGSYQDGATAQAELTEVARQLRLFKDQRIYDVGTYLKRQAGELVAYHARIAAALTGCAHTIDEQALVLTIACLHRIDREKRSPMYRRQRRELTRLREQMVAQLHLLDLTPERMAELMLQSLRVIRDSGRASSLVECFNGVIRKFLRIHKHVSEGPLLLIAARWNLREREDGPLTGSCPYTALTGQRVEDWLAFLGLPDSGFPRLVVPQAPRHSARAQAQPPVLRLAA